MKIIAIRNADYIKVGDIRISLRPDTMIEVMATGRCYDLHIQEVNLPDLTDEEKQMALEKKIHAIRDYRNRTGVGLLEAKTAVETYLQQRG